ncbi:hypothetical protein MKX47_12260 [Solibacillus sp. FSL R7-0668]|uniref:phage tail protein n=1 Tax=Solibacillus sp. FSL R7-0668 TaxID=2921688 RepID=UPI0030FB3FB9
MEERFEAHVGANIREFQRKMREVDREIEQLATGVDVDLELAAGEFHAEMQRVRSEMADLDREDLTVQVDLAWKEFMRDLMEVYAMAENLDDSVIDVEIEAIIGDFRRDLLRVRALAQDLDGTNVDVEVDLDTSAFTRALYMIYARLWTLDAKEILVSVKLKYNEFQNNMARVANQMRNWGEILSTQLSGAMIALLPILSQLISTLVGLIGSLGVMVGVLAGQFLILASALSIAAIGFVGLAAVAIPTIKDLFDETVKLTAEQQRARDAWDGFIDVYDELVVKTESAVLSAFTSAMQGASEILKSLEPMILGVADSAAKLMDSFNRSINTEPIQAIFEAFNEFGPSIFENFTTGIGYLVAGLGSLIAALAPAAAAWTENFNLMMESFAEWSAGLSESEKFQEFISYVQEHMPLISQMFGDLVVGIVEFFSAFSGMASDFMVSLAEIIEGFREWASTLDQNDSFQRFLDFIRESTPAVLDLLKNLWQFLVNLGIAMAPFGAIILDLVNKFLAWMNAMMETHGWFSNLIGIIPVLIGGFMMLMAPVVGLVTLFGKQIVDAITKTNNGFRAVQTAISKLAPHFGVIIDDVMRFIGVVTNLASKALPLLMRGFTLLTGPVGIAIAIITTLITIGIALYKNWDEIWAYAKSIWTKIANFFSTTVAGIYDTVVGWFGDMWDGISGFMGDILKTITDGWNKAASFLESIDLATIGKNIVQGLVNGISSGFEWVKKKVSELANLIPDWLKGPLKIFSPSRTMAAVSKWIPAGVAKGILDNVNLVKEAAKKMSDSVTLDYSKQVNKASSVFKNLMNTMSDAVKATSKKQQADRYEALEKSLSDYKKWTDLTLEEEYGYWQEAAKYLKDGTGAKNKALKNASDIHQQILQEQFNNEISFIDAAREYGMMSLADQIKAYEEYMAQYKLGTEQQVAYEEKLYNAKKTLYEDLKNITSDYLSKVQDIYSKLGDEEQKLRDQYQQTFEARKETLANTWGLFDEVKLTEMITYKDDGSIDKQVDLIGNMRQQVATMSNWMNDIFRLQSFGLDEALLKELQNMGPKAAAEINALANMSSQQLSEYEQLWKTKMDLAGAQATNELASAREDMENEIIKLRENAIVEIEKLKNEMLKEIDEMVNGSVDEFDYLEATLPEIGRKAMQGLIDGFKSMKGSLDSTLQGIVNDVSNSMSGILSGEHFNATTNVPELSFNGNAKINTSLYNENELAQAPVNVSVNQMWDGDSVKTWIDETDATKAKLNIKKRK